MVLNLLNNRIQQLPLPEHTNISGLTWTPDNDALVIALHNPGGPRLVGVRIDGSGTFPIEGFGEQALYPDMRGDLLAFTKSSVNTDLFSATLPSGGGDV